MPQQFDCLARGGGRGGIVAGLLQNRALEFYHIGFIVDAKYSRHEILKNA